MNSEEHALKDYQYIFNQFCPNIKTRDNYIFEFEKDKVILKHKITKNNETKYNEIETFTTVESLYDCLCEGIDFHDDNELTTLTLKLENVINHNVPIGLTKESQNF